MGLVMLATCVHHQSFGNAHYYIYYIYEECSQVALLRWCLLLGIVQALAVTRRKGLARIW